MSLPKKISPCPIIDSILEIRYSSSFPKNAIFGVIYNQLRAEYSKTENLPILQLPEPVRNSDPNFKFKPHYRISNDEFVIQIGPDVLAISSYPDYVGWNKFSSEIYRLIDSIAKLEIIDKVERIAFRTIDFFDLNIFENIELEFSINNKSQTQDETFMMTNINHNDIVKSTLKLSNNSESKGKRGSLIDVDTFVADKLDSFLTDYKPIIDDLHENQKKLFFSFLKEDFLKSLNPEY